MINDRSIVCSVPDSRLDADQLLLVIIVIPP